MVSGLDKWNKALRTKDVCENLKSVWVKRVNRRSHLLQRVPKENVGWTFAVLLCKANDQWMIEALRPRKRSPRLRVCHGRNHRVIMTRNVLLEQFHDPCRILRFWFGS